MTTRILSSIFLLFSQSLCLATSGLAQDLTRAEREKALRYLTDTRGGVVDAVKGLSDAQWKFKSSPYRWSIAEIVEHIAVTEGFFVHNIFERLRNAPAESSGRDANEVDAMILSRVPDRSAKFRAPDPLVPTGRWTPQAALEHFVTSRSQTISFLDATTDLRRHLVSHPVLGPLDGYQWVLTIAAHSERHLKQIMEVKAEPNFPTK